MEQQFTYDIFIIGGGSGGLSCARAAVSYGAKVGLADFVKPSPHGTKWGLGGTCVNVGCIPKKLFHYVSLLGQSKKDLSQTGWKIDSNSQHQWEVVSQKIRDYIHSLNFGYRSALLKEQITYQNKLASIKSKHEVQLTAGDGTKQTVTAKYIVIATGGRPSIPNIPGKQHSISSDDIFWRSTKPGKILVVGASYIALECAGYLHGLGVDVTVMVRSIFLRGFDQQLANKIGKYMQEQGVKFIKNATPTSIVINKQGQKVVTYKQGEVQIEDIYEQVMFATGRGADTQNIGLETVGVKTASNGKIIAGENDQTAVENIFAIGDCVQGRLQLTPTAILAGKLLSARLFDKKTRLMSYKFVPTTVFTPIQYGCCGYSQEQAQSKFGKENVISYGSVYKPLEWALNYQRKDDCYAKLVVNKADNNKVLGLHVLGPNAGQITQGFAVAILMGCTKDDFDYTVGIHPTMAEEFTLLKHIAGSADQQKTGC